ncbi:dethiobiotin synthase [Anaerotignum lactatifermentans]|uniref:ATP-dependent dethiobiotin synthetase BioD n=1 Tax=Anaerotignum lactatifermentans TaxID=160404 RepID=A0ABS2G8A2_9FIRM|nr:dethiobiotin synthase [Anaerotignum lactatifermentans]MBM6877689.1 dethiobiotin synthase [Anaerotignum lactatifermentans]MBM6949992.1 dethiobiotin synthase [Anaerotignum lactatifermentans]
MGKKIFIVGTGTDVGKTYITGLILKKLKENGISAAYYKAAMSGNQRRQDGSLIPGDGVFVKNMSGIGQSLEEMCPYVYEAAVSPHLAAQLEGTSVSLEGVKEGFASVLEKYDYVAMEGSGGILCPIRMEKEEIWLEDIIKSLGLSCILVADAGLGVINNVGLTAAYLKMRNISLKGIIFNHYLPGSIMQEDNIRMCESLTGTKVIACVKDGDENLNLSLDALCGLFEEGKKL